MKQIIHKQKIISHIFIILTIAAASIFAWYKVLFTIFLSEGAMYFSFNYLNQPVKFSYGQGAILVTNILMPIFGDNILLYNIFLLSIAVLLGILFYLLVYKATDSKQIAFISSIIFNINSWVLFEFYGYGWYNRWLERPIWLLFAFSSFYFYIEYIKHRKIKVLLVSLILYIIGVYLGEHNILFLPVFFFYIIGLHISKINFKKIKFTKENLKDIFIPIPFLIYSFIILQLSKPNPYVVSMFSYSTMSSFTFTPILDIIDLVLKQLVLLTIPSQFIPFNIWGISSNVGVKELYIPVLVLYLIAFIFVYKKKEYRTIVIVSLLLISISLVLNIFIRQDIVRSMPEGYRYLLIASVGYSIFWGIFLYSLFNKGLWKLILLLFMIWWVSTNRDLINTRIDNKYESFQAVRASLAYIKSLSPKFHNDSIVITPMQLSSWGVDFAGIFYGKDTMLFLDRWIPDAMEYKMKRPFDPKKDFILRYDKKLHKVVDETKNYKEIAEGTPWAKEIFW